MTICGSTFGDTMEWAWTSAENAQERNSAMAIAELDAKARKAMQMKMQRVLQVAQSAD